LGVQARAQPDRAAAAGPGCRHLAWRIIVDVAEKITQRLIIDAAWLLLVVVGRVHRCPGASGAPAYLGARPRRVRRQDGDRGVSTGCGRSFLVGCSGARAGSNRVAGSW